MDIDTIKKIEEYIKTITKDVSSVHGFMHLQRTAIGAKWFTECFGGSEDEGNIAYLAGLIHDLKRPSTEKIDHTELSVKEAKNVLSKFSVPDSNAKHILQLIEEHRIFHDTTSVQQSVFLSDKLLEQSGAYIAFRRNYYIGECEDFETTPFGEAVKTYWESRMKRFSPQRFDGQVRKLAISQFAWAKEFFDAFLQQKSWARNIAKDFYMFGRDHRPNLDLLIKTYGVEHPETGRFQEEAVHYMQGKKYSFYKPLLCL